MINPEGFIKYSGIFEGNMQDSNTLKGVVKDLRAKTSTSGRAIVVIDAGIAMDENLAMLTENGFDYVCASRSKIKDYTVDTGSVPITIEDKKRQKIQLQKVVSEKHNDFFLKLESEAKRAKALSMNNRFQEGFEKGLSIISASLTKKSGIKMEEKVYERVGRLTNIAVFPHPQNHPTTDGSNIWQTQRFKRVLPEDIFVNQRNEPIFSKCVATNQIFSNFYHSDNQEYKKSVFLYFSKNHCNFVRRKIRQSYMPINIRIVGYCGN